MKRRWHTFWVSYRRPILIWLAITAMVVLGLILHIQGRVIAVIAILFGLLTQAFSGLLALLALVPWIGPLIVKALSIPLVWLMNALGYFSAVILVKRGYGRDVLKTRVITVAVIIGIVIGYILGKLV
ncbi:MAG: hypothetical protein FJY66_03135 [Calditrichaeota bacterium]|nr:hypothetical protein [Calditrichota bacterium]